MCTMKIVQPHVAIAPRAARHSRTWTCTRTTTVTYVVLTAFESLCCAVADVTLLSLDSLLYKHEYVQNRVGISQLR